MTIEVTATRLFESDHPFHRKFEALCEEHGESVEKVIAGWLVLEGGEWFINCTDGSGVAWDFKIIEDG